MATESRTKRKVVGYILVTHIIKKEGDKFTSHCPELDVASLGDTVEEAHKNLVDAVLLYLNSIEELGLIEEIFEECGIKFYKKPPKKISMPHQEFDIDDFYIHPELTEITSAHA